MPDIVRVFSLGGSVFAADRPDLAYLQGLAAVLAERLACGERLLIVTGGGRPAREWIKAARDAGVQDEAALDRVGIQATRLNAELVTVVLRRHLGPAVAVEVPHDVASTAALLRSSRVAVMGGTLPGHSTDFVAASLATAAGADHLYVLTNVSGVYTADPRHDPAAEHLQELTSSALIQLAGDPEWTAGRSGVVDPACARHVHEARLPVTVMDGRDLEALRADLRGERGAGSIVHPDARAPTPGRGATHGTGAQ